MQFGFFCFKKNISGLDLHLHSVLKIKPLKLLTGKTFTRKSFESLKKLSTPYLKHSFFLKKNCFKQG